MGIAHGDVADETWASRSARVCRRTRVFQNPKLGCCRRSNAQCFGTCIARISHESAGELTTVQISMSLPARCPDTLPLASERPWCHDCDLRLLALCIILEAKPRVRHRYQETCRFAAHTPSKLASGNKSQLREGCTNVPSSLYVAEGEHVHQTEPDGLAQVAVLPLQYYRLPWLTQGSR